MLITTNNCQQSITVTTVDYYEAFVKPYLTTQLTYYELVAEVAEKKRLRIYS